MVSGLSDERLAAIESALVAIDERVASARAAMVAEREARQDLALSWALEDGNVLWCVVTRERFVRAGGPGWVLLGYQPATIEGRRWQDFVASPEEVAESQKVIAHNAATGLGVDGYVNHYLCADGSTRALRWRVSPWYSGADGEERAVARAEVL